MILSDEFVERRGMKFDLIALRESQARLPSGRLSGLLRN
jgi:hypothetical protein